MKKNIRTCVSVFIYIYVCVCVCVSVFGQHFFINAYFIKQYRHVLSIYFCICPFQLLNCFYRVWWELVDEMYMQRSHRCCNIHTPDDGPRSSRKYKNNN